MLDVIVRLEEPLAQGDDVRAQTRTGAGGQAANVAAWAVALGAEARCIAKRGDDAAGELVARELAGLGVELVRPGRRGCDRRRRLARRRRRRSLDGFRPRRRAVACARGARRRLGRMRRAPPLGLRALARADRAHCAPRRAARPRGGRTRLRRRRGVDGDPRVSARCSSASCSTRSRPTSSSRPRPSGRCSAAPISPRRRA